MNYNKFKTGDSMLCTCGSRLKYINTKCPKCKKYSDETERHLKFRLFCEKANMSLWNSKGNGGFITLEYDDFEKLIDINK